MLKQTLFSIFRNWELVREMAVCDLQAFSKGAFLGRLWAFLSFKLRRRHFINQSLAERNA